jgi:hypothetical protein
MNFFMNPGIRRFPRNARIQVFYSGFQDDGVRVGSANEAGKDQGFGLIQTMRMFSKKAAGGGGNACVFAAKTDQIQIGFQNLVF